MNFVADIIMLLGGIVALLAGAGLLKFDTSYARFHAAGKASPIAFVVAAVGASFHLDWQGNVYLVIAAVAMILTLPVGIHLMFRAVHRTTPGTHLAIDDLASAQEAASEKDLP